MLEPLADLDRHATERPDSPALCSPRRQFSFAQLRTAVLAVAARLDRAGVASGTLVGIDLPTALEWIVDLALLRLGARSVSLRGVTNPGPTELDALITDPGRRAAPAALTIEADDLWLDSAIARGDDPPPVADFGGDDAIFRLILTSGTTGGVPKAAAYSLGALEYRSAEQHVHWTDGRPELTLIGLSTTGGFHAAIASLRLGVPYLAVDRIDAETMRFAAEQKIEVLCGSPSQVARAIHAARDADIELPSLTEVRLAGAGPTAGLLALIAEHLRVPVRGVYGSTEGGGISQRWFDAESDLSAAGVPLPGVELEVVDGSGMPVPPGVEGAVRCRTPGLVSGYFVDGHVVPFEDGWFTPGDRGTLTTDGELVLGGRDTEIFNLGGVKIDPATVDEPALAFPGVIDAAAFAVERVPGLAEVGLAVVTQVGCDLRELDRQLRARLPLGHPTAFWSVAEIPRTRLGKPMRAMLSEQFARLPR
ncbi:MAG TPA: class I adenylate-forming enzyme family protein [Rhodoglobus sp.]|nr:class I adenylate-forming enzyme family protein [Rhodoglobus sp.]